MQKRNSGTRARRRARRKVCSTQAGEFVRERKFIIFVKANTAAPFSKAGDRDGLEARGATASS